MPIGRSARLGQWASGMGAGMGERKGEKESIVNTIIFTGENDVGSKKLVLIIVSLAMP